MKNIRWLFVLLGIAGLVGVRVLEDKLFYDPFLEYFRVSDEYLPFPSFDWGRLILNHLFRFFLNLTCSLVILHFLFLNKVWTLQGFFLIVIFFVVFFFVYLLMLREEVYDYNTILFYLRRIVIHPIYMFVILSIFYYRFND